MIDYMVMEAVCLRVNREDEIAREKAEDEAERREWKKKGKADEAVANGLEFEKL